MSAFTIGWHFATIGDGEIETMIKNDPSVGGSSYVGKPQDDMDVESTRGAKPRTEPPKNEATPASESSQGASTADAEDPTSGARDVSKPKRPTAAEIEAEVESQLCATDPQFKADLEKYKLLEKIEAGLGGIDACQGWRGDGIVEGWDLEHIANNPNATPEAKEAAKILLANPMLWKELATKNVADDRVSFGDVSSAVQEMRTKLEEKKKTIRPEVKAQMYEDAGVGQSPSTGGSGSPPSGAPGSDGAHEPLFPSFPPSPKSGLEGAVENIQSALDSIADEIGKQTLIANDPKASPEDRQKAQKKLTELMQAQTMAMSLLSQLQQAISNMMKIYADIASNSIRNMR